MDPIPISKLGIVYGNFMRNPAPVGPRVCPTCRGFMAQGFAQCRGCHRQPDFFDVIVPVTYSLGRGQMHLALRSYKDGPAIEVRRKFTLELAGILWYFQEMHEQCIAAKAGVAEFDLVSAVPSSDPDLDESRGNLRNVVGRICRPTAPRYERLIFPTGADIEQHVYDERRFSVNRRLDGRSVLLIDDTWTTGASAQSAGAALRSMGAETIALVVLGRHVGPDYEDHAQLFAELPQPFDWHTCSVHASH